MQNYEEQMLWQIAAHEPADQRDIEQGICRENAACARLPEHTDHAFANPFQIEDLEVFDRKNLARVLATIHFTPEHLAWSLHKAPASLVRDVRSCLAADEQAVFCREWSRPVAEDTIALARHLLLDALFWELTYWKTPELYEELVAGEQLHPGIFQQLEPLLRHKIVLDAGAGSGRASFAALEHGAALVYALEPSPGLRRIFAEKLEHAPAASSIVLREGDFARLPLPDQSVDLALTCSAFTAEPGQGGEPGLAEFRRVTRQGGYIVIIWPRPQDRSWLAARGFRYAALPHEQEMYLSFTSWASAWRCTCRFYAHNKNVARYLRRARLPRLPFSILGYNPPCDYCWLQLR